MISLHQIHPPLWNCAPEVVHGNLILYATSGGLLLASSFWMNYLMYVLYQPFAFCELQFCFSLNCRLRTMLNIQDQEGEFFKSMAVWWLVKTWLHQRIRQKLSIRYISFCFCMNYLLLFYIILPPFAYVIFPNPYLNGLES